MVFWRCLREGERCQPRVSHPFRQSGRYASGSHRFSTPQKKTGVHTARCALRLRTLSWLLISMLLNRGPSRSPAFDVQYRQSQQAGCRPKRTAGKVSAATSVPYVHIPPYAHNCGCMEDMDCMNCVPLRGRSLGRLELELLLGTRGKRSNGFAAVRLSLQSSEVPHLVEKKIRS